MNKEEYTSHSLIEDIRSGGLKRDNALKYIFLHKHYKAIVHKAIVEAGGEGNDVDTVWRQCIITFEQQVRRLAWKEDDVFDLFLEREAKAIWCTALRINEKVRNNVLKHIGMDNELKKKIFGSIIGHGGKREDAEDCYQNGMMQLDVQLREGKYKGGAIKGFFYQVCYNLWRNEWKRTKPVSLEGQRLDHLNSPDPQHVLETVEREELLDTVFQQLGESCKKILQLKFFIIDQLTMDEIAQQMGLKSAQNASNALSKCRKRLWELLQKQEYEHDLWKKNI